MKYDLSCFDTTSQLEQAVKSLIELLGPDTLVSDTWESKTNSGGEYISGDVMLEYIFINKKTGLVVGDEANDYVPNDNECPAIKIS